MKNEHRELSELFTGLGTGNGQVLHAVVLGRCHFCNNGIGR